MLKYRSAENSDQSNAVTSHEEEKLRARNAQHRNKNENSPIQQTQRKITAVSMCRERHARHRAQVVNPVEMGFMRRSVVSTEKKID